MKKIFLLFACSAFLQVSAQHVMVANFEENGTDKLIENRILPEDGVVLEIVDNPVSDSEVNASSKVMKMSNVTVGRFGIGLEGYWVDNAYTEFSNSDDFITLYDEEAAVANYNTMRFKVYMEGKSINSNTLQPYVEFYDYGPDGGQPARDLGVWTNELEGPDETWSDWNTFTIEYTPMKKHGRMILIINNGQWEADPDVTFYIDDIEFYDSYTYTKVEENMMDQVNCLMDGKVLTVSDVPARSVLSVYDIGGRTLFSTRVEDGTAQYMFQNGGLYLVRVENGQDNLVKKVVVK